MKPRETTTISGEYVNGQHTTFGPNGMVVYKGQNEYFAAYTVNNDFIIQMKSGNYGLQISPAGIKK